MHFLLLTKPRRRSRFRISMHIVSRGVGMRVCSVNHSASTAKKRARGRVMQLELQGRDRRRDRVVPVGQLHGFPRHGHPPREPRLPPRACSPAGWLFGAPKSTFLTSDRPPEAISDRSLRGSQNGMSRMRGTRRTGRRSSGEPAAPPPRRRPYVRYIYIHVCTVLARSSRQIASVPV